MINSRRLVLAGVLIVASALGAGAQPAPPVLTAPVNDFARTIDPASEQELERLIRALQSATGDVVTVATVPTFQPYGDINSYAVKMDLSGATTGTLTVGTAGGGNTFTNNALGIGISGAGTGTISSLIPSGS